MAIQYTATVGEISTNVVRTTVTADPAANEVVMVITTAAEGTDLYRISDIVEGFNDLANRFLNPTQYSFNPALIKGLENPIGGANGIASAVAATPGTQGIGIFCGSGVNPSNMITNQTIKVMIETLIETEGVQ
jgi:hypothetical protein